MQHARIESADDIPDLCKSVFFTKEKLYGLAWALAVIFVAGYGSAVVYAINTSVSVTRLESRVLETKNTLDYLSTNIDKKLDIIISKTNE